MCASLRVSRNPMAKRKQRCVWRRLRRQPSIEILLVASTELIPISRIGDGRKLRAHIFGLAKLLWFCWAVSTAEHACYDPKDSELCLARVKPQETGVEARSRCDVQIHGVSWA